MLRASRSFGLGFLLGLGGGAAIGAFAASLLAAERSAEIRTWLARRILRRKPHVKFETLQQ